MKKIIESLFNLFFAQPEDISESEKTPFLANDNDFDNYRVNGSGYLSG